jgi:D-alanyl-D-alanine carboxypeptidase
MDLDSARELGAGLTVRSLRIVSAVAALAVSAAVVTGTAGASPATKRADRALDRALEGLVGMPGGPPGVAAVIQRGRQEALHTAGVADVDRKRPIDGQDHMRVASVSKAFSGAAALSLVDRGKLRLGDTIGRRLPGMPAAWGAVTVRELLNHTSGLPDFTAQKKFQEFVSANPHQSLPHRRLIDFVADKPLEFAPGTQYAYSNTDNIVVALMVEAVSGRSYENQLRKLVFRPLDLTETTLPAGFEIPRPFVHGYDVQPGQPPEDVSTVLSVSTAWASGGIVSTPEDLNDFIRGYVGGSLFGGAARRGQLRFVQGSSDPPGPGKNAAGLAVFRYRTPCGKVFGHTGSFPGYTQFAAATRNGRRSVTVSANAQLSPSMGAKGVFSALRKADALAVCAALAR